MAGAAGQGGQLTPEQLKELQMYSGFAQLMQQQPQNPYIQAQPGSTLFNGTVPQPGQVTPEQSQGMLNMFQNGSNMFNNMRSLQQGMQNQQPLGFGQTVSNLNPMYNQLQQGSTLNPQQKQDLGPLKGVYPQIPGLGPLLTKGPQRGPAPRDMQPGTLQQGLGGLRR
jgi:hypothetical protein